MRLIDQFAQTDAAGIMLGEAHLEEHGSHNQKSHGGGEAPLDPDAPGEDRAGRSLAKSTVNSAFPSVSEDDLTVVSVRRGGAGFRYGVEGPGGRKWGVYYDANQQSAMLESALSEHGHHNQKSHGRTFSGIAAATDRWGGTSVNYVGHQPKTGYMVGGVVPSKVVPGGASRSEVHAAIKDFVNEHRETLRKPGMYLGTWRDDDDGGKVWIDISQRTGTLRAARQIGTERNEIAVFDVKRMESINIGGTGNAEG